VIKHSKSIEETAALFTRYMKILVENPRYSRVLLGLPGIFLLVIGAMLILNLDISQAGIALALIIGGYLVVRGFRLDKSSKEFYHWLKDYSPPPFSVQIAGYAAIAGFLLIIVGGYLGGTAVANVATNYTEPLAHVPELAGHFLNGATYLVAVGICVTLVGRAIRWFFEHDVRLWRTIVIVFAMAWSSVMFTEGAKLLVNPTPDYDTLVMSIIVGIPVIVAAFSVVVVLRKKYDKQFEASKDSLRELD
jgi:putative membrane protein